MSSIYGYWVSRDDIIPVPYECHCEVAISILAERFGVSTDDVCERVLRLHFDLPFYVIMLRLGYVRVVCEKSGGTSVEHWHSARLSQLQKSFVCDATWLDGKQTYKTML